MRDKLSRMWLVDTCARCEKSWIMYLPFGVTCQTPLSLMVRLVGSLAFSISRAFRKCWPSVLAMLGDMLNVVVERVATWRVGSAGSGVRTICVNFKSARHVAASSVVNVFEYDRNSEERWCLSGSWMSNAEKRSNMSYGIQCWSFDRQGICLSVEPLRKVDVCLSHASCLYTL